MRLYFDDKYYKVFKENFIIWYFGNLHKAIKLDYFYSEILETILTSKQGVHVDNISFDYISNDDNKIYRFIELLLNRKIIFENKSNLHNNYFNNKYKNILYVDSKRAYLHLTQKCNLKCSYCYNKHNLNKKVYELTTQEWIDVVNKLSKLNYKDVTLTGGEAFFRRDILEIVKGIRKKVNNLTILTNGTLLKTDVAKKTIAYADQVIISLDSLNETINNKHRKYSDRYKILENIISQDEKSKITIRSVISKSNAHEINQLDNYFSNLGYKFITVNLLPNKISENNLFCSSFSLKDFELNSNLHYVTKCGAGVDVISIDSNGDVYPCQTLMFNNFKVGNIFDSGCIDKLVNRFSKEIIDITQIDECKDCKFKFICGGGCRALNFNLYGALNVKNKYLCNAYKERSKRFIYGLF